MTGLAALARKAGLAGSEVPEKTCGQQGSIAQCRCLVVGTGDDLPNVTFNHWCSLLPNHQLSDIPHTCPCGHTRMFGSNDIELAP